MRTILCITYINMATTIMQIIIFSIHTMHKTITILRVLWRCPTYPLPFDKDSTNKIGRAKMLRMVMIATILFWDITTSDFVNNNDVSKSNNVDESDETFTPHFTLMKSYEIDARENWRHHYNHLSMPWLHSAYSLTHDINLK